MFNAVFTESAFELTNVVCTMQVVECIMTVQRDHGERVDRKHARLKYTVEDHGVKWIRERVEERCG